MAKHRPERPTETRNFERVAAGLFGEGEERERFREAVDRGECRRPAVIWIGERTEIEVLPRLEWQPAIVDRLPESSRAGADPRHDAGRYYCLDFSSVGCASVLTAITRPISSIIDLCASPGGKSIFAWRVFQPEVLVCNEVIRKRTAQLLANLRRCGICAYVTTSDVSIFSRELPQAADLIIIDAPCSGQSLLARGKRAPACFHPSTINQNANRQKRIIANGGQCVAPDGYLAYMTCTYSLEENERIIEWFLARNPAFSPIEVPHLSSLRSPYSEHPCYRLFPQHGIGAGGFACLLHRQSARDRSEPTFEKLDGNDALLTGRIRGIWSITPPSSPR